MRRNRKKKADGAGTSTKTIPQDKDYWNITEVIKRLQAISTQCGMPVLVETQNKHQDMKTLREWMAKLMISTGEHDSARLMTEEGFFRYLRHRVTAHENRLKASETAAMDANKVVGWSRSKRSKVQNRRRGPNRGGSK